jgi:hypothetical protein
MGNESQLDLFTKYHEEEVRSVELIGSAGCKCQLWIDAPDQSGNILVHVWDYREQRKEFKTTVTELNDSLEKAYEIATKWLEKTPK